MNRTFWLDSLKDSAKPNMDECIEYLGDIFPLLKEFKNTPQDPIWHAEGNVHIHTDMVLHELYQIFDTEQFVPTPDQRQILILAALLHDIAKPITTSTDETGRVRARKHEELGLNYLSFRLLELELPSESVVEILHLVGYHQKPKLLVIKNEPRHEYLKLANLVNYELMYWLEVADMKGRVCQDLEEQLLYLDEYLAITKEELTKPFRYHLSDIPANADPEVRYYRNTVGHYLINHGIVDSLEQAHSKLYEPSQKYSKFVMIVGISGTGKSTLAQSAYPFFKLVSLDKLRNLFAQGPRLRSKEMEGKVIQEAKQIIKDSLHHKVDVVFDATNLRRELREQILTIAENYGALTSIHVLMKPKSQILKQNKQRFAEIPEEVIDRQIEKFQLPHANEAHIVYYDINYDKN